MSHKKQDPLIKQLLDYRLKKQVPQKELARQLGIGFVTLSRWLNGHQKPGALARYRIEQFLRGK